jgi:putative exporter of polyketide antibiotics
MARNTEQKKVSDPETVSDQEIWQAIRRLDPDAEKDRSDIAGIIALISLLCTIFIVGVLLHLRGL